MPTDDNDAPLFQPSELELPRPLRRETPRRWRKVTPPRTWRPRESGAEIAGVFRGKTKQAGTHGQYEVVLVDVPEQGRLMVSGITCIQAVDASGIATGEPIRIVFRGTKVLDAERTMKMFDVYVEET